MNSIINVRRLANDKGSILVFAVILSMATIALGTAYLQFVDHQRRQISYDILSNQATLAAHAAMVRGQILHPSSGDNYQEALQEFYDDDESYSVSNRYYCVNTGNEDFGFGSTTNYNITGEGNVTGIEFDHIFVDSVGHDMSSRSYANWLYISDRETQSYRPVGDDIIRFWGPDTLDGKVHSNDMLHFQEGSGYWPVFEKKVTSCSSRFDPEYAAEVVNFYGDYEIPYSYFTIPVTADSVRKYNWYNDPNLGVENEDQWDDLVTEIVLQPSYFVCRKRKISSGSRNLESFPVDPEDDNGYLVSLSSADVYTYPPNGALFIEGELWLVGPKNGALHFNSYSAGGQEDDFPVYGFNDQLTIGASGDIIIAQDVMYTDFLVGPDSMPTSSEAALGLISEKHILVWRNAPSYINITAGLGAIGYMLDEDSTLQRWDAVCYNDASLIPVNGIYGTISIDGINCYGWENEKQELLIYGCLIQRERGLVHSSYPDYVNSRGYVSKAYRYDNRFINNPPPHFFEVKSVGNFYSERRSIWRGGYE